MVNPLLVRALPEHLAERRQAIEVVENIGFFKRLAAIVEADLAALAADKIPPLWRDSPVTIGLAFGWADARQQLPMLSGRLEARVDAVCQRCLEPCVLQIEQSVRLLLVHEQTAGSSDSGFEIWEPDEETVRPFDIVEELLVMSLPMAAMHARAENCGRLAARLAPARQNTARPFADLKARIDQTD